MVGQPWLTNPTSVRKDTGSSATPNTWRGTILTSAGVTPKRTQGIWFAIESTPEAPLTYTYSNGNTSVGCGANYTGEFEVIYHIVSGDDGLPLITNEGGEIVPIATEVSYGIAQHGEYKFTYNADVDHQPLWRFDGWYWDEELTQRINPNQIFVITEDKDVYGTYYYYGSNLIDKQYLDVTGSVTAEPDDDTHVCTSSTYLVNKYDGTYHWQECAVCSTRYVAAGRPDDATTWENEYLEIKQNANGQRILAIRDSHVNHTYTSYWSMGDSCNENNKNVHTCTCGYSYKTDNTREHQSFTAKNDLQNYWYAEICDSCGYNRIRQRCEDASGVKINCGHLGTCALCGYTYTKKVHHPRVVGTIPNRIDDSNHPILVCDCGQITAEVMSLQIEHGTTIYMGPSIPEADRTRRQVTGTVVIKPATYQQPTAYEGLPYFDAGEITSNTTTWDQTSGQITQTLVARFDDATHIETTDSRVVFWYDVDVSTNERIRYSFYQCVTPEVTPPTVSVTQNQTEFVNGWAINNSLTVSGTENYCSSVGVVMKDHETQDVIYSGTANVSGSFNPRLPNEYSLVFSPDISASAGGRQFDITVTDPLGNSTTETVILYKVDNEAPAYNKDGQIRTVNEEDVWGTNNEWSKDKDFDVKFYDAGTYEAKAKIQNVTSTDTGLTFTDVFGISSVDESFLPPQYTRSYNFTGNLKGYSTILTQSEDGAGNKVADYFRVYNLDNTEPEISNAQYDGESTTIIKATLSDAHSGIRYFGIVPKGTGEISYPSNYPTSGTPSLLAASYNTWYEVSLIPANAELDTPESGRDSIDVRFKIDEVGEYYLITEDYVGNRNYKLFNANREIIDESIEPVYIEKKYIDVTGAVTSTQTNDSHLCIDPDYIITKFDGTYHWNECKICSARYISAGRPEDGSAWENDYLEITLNSNGQRILAVKNSLTSHNYTTDYWTAGSANVCLETNKHIFVCNCGYSKSSIEGRRAHVPKEEYLHRWNMCYEECQNCTYSRKLHVCKDSSGNEINCDNWTVCAECGYDWSTNHPYHNMVFLDPTITNKDDESTLGDSGTRICWMCRRSFGGVNVTSGYNVITQGREVEVWTTWQLTPDTDSTYDSQYDDAWLSTNDAGLTITSTTSTKSGNYVTLRSRVTYPTTPHVETGKIYLKHRIWYKYNGVWVEDSVGHYEKDKDIYFVPETIAPTISSITQNPISTYNDWARDTEIVVSGTENYCSSVNVVMKDHDTGEVIYKGSTSVNSGNYSLSFSPGLSASVDGRQYDIIVSDTLKNSSSQSITITKMDNEDPSLDKTNQIVIMSGENIWGTEVEWSKDKDFDISFYDDGTDLAISKIQNVTSSKTGDTFIDSYGITPPENSSVTPTKYFRAYNFTGDVKGYVTLLESCKDAAGNKKEEYFRVYNLDNTNPEISGEQYDGDSTSMIKATLKDAHSGIKYFGIVPKESDTIAYPSAYPDGSVSTTSALDLNTWYQVPLIPANDIENTPESGQESVEVRLRALRRGTYYIITEDYVGNRNAKEFYAYKNNTDDDFELTFVEKQFLDVTGAITQTQSEHYHVCNDGEHLVQKYDGTYHWEECSICSKNYINAGRPNESDWENEFLEIKQNENGQNILVIKNSLEAHTYAQSYWLLGTNSCSDKNVHVMLCDCGYSYNDSSTKIKEHTWNMSTWESVDGFKHGHKCSSCGEYKDVARCYKTGGTLLGCDTRATGTCAVCGNNRNNLRHRFNVSEGFEEVMTDIKCLICNAVICSRRTYTVAPTATPGVLRLTIVYELPAAYSAIGTHDDKFMVGQSSSMYGEVVGTSTRSVSADHKTVTMSGNYRYTTDAYSRVLKVGIGFYFTRAADNTETYLNTFIPVPKEINAPVISNISQDIIAQYNGWATNTNITISGTEDYCPLVTIEMKDHDTGAVVYSATADVTGGNYSISFVPDVYADATGKEYDITVTDTIGNSSTQTIVITKFDREPPTFVKTGQLQIIDGEEVWGTEVPWSKSKDFTITMYDNGSDTVEAEIQDVISVKTDELFEDEYGTTAVDDAYNPRYYTREYQFTGDVKGYVTIRTDGRDMARNHSSDYFRVYNLDNTDPVIDPNPIIDTENHTITVKVSDAHSGVRYFGFLYYEMENVEYPSSYPSDSTMTASSPGAWYQVPLIPANSATNEPESGIASGDVILNYETGGRYYIIVEDYVGNRNYAELLIGNDYAIPPVMSSYSGDYDGEPHHVMLEDSGNGGTLQYSLDGENWTNGSPETVTRTNAGVTTVYARIKGDSSHDDSDVETAEIRINKLFLDAPDMQGFMGAYDGVPHHVTLLSAGSAGNGGTLQYSLDGETWTDGSPETVTRTALGTTTVYARVKGDENHEDSSIVSADITIAQFDYNIIEKKTVNVTGSTTEPAIASTHNCNDYSVPKYDDRYHWNECSICSSNYVLASRPEDPTGFITDYTEIKTNNAGKRILVIKDSFLAHTYTSSWSLTGTNKCSPSNKYYRTCNCGYSYNDTSVQNTYSHNWVAKINVSKTSHATRCSNCNTIKAGTEERHKNSSGQTIGCDTGVYGSCAICPGGITGHTFNNDTNWQTTSSIDLKCILCNRKLGTRTYSISRASNGVITFTEKYVLVDAFKPTNGVTQYRLDGGGASMVTITQNPTCSVSSDKRTVTLSTKFKFNAYYETSAALALIIYCKDSSNRTNYLAAYVHISPDVTAPTISQVTQTNVVQSNGWEVNSNISITGTENYSNRVYITMEDTSNSTRVYSGAANVSSGNYSLNFAPDYLDAPDSGRTYTITVQDVFGNTTTRNITITKHDGTKPEYLKSDQLSEYDGEIAWGTIIPWSKTKDFIVKARDLGTNFTEIKLQNVTNTDNGATFVDEYGITTYSTLNPIEYTREYEFVGNVRGYITMKIDAKDQANNILSDYFRIYNLDNTNPEVDPSYVENGDDKQIEATLLDSLSGIKYFGLVPNANGVAIYPTTYNNTPTTVATDINQWYQAPLTAENTTTKEPEHGHESLGVSLKIPANGNYFIVVEDYVGNRSSFGITMAALDETPPHGTIVLKDPLISIDALEGVKENYATLLINATDDEGTVEYMALANEDNRTTINWIEYDTEIDWTLSSEDGYKVVYVMFKDDSGNVSVSFGP